MLTDAMTDLTSAADVGNRYYATARREILPYLPERVERMLDLGCGVGATSMLVKSLRDVAWAGGVEIVADAADKARPLLDQLWCIDAERETFESGIAPASLDLILCLDVLEHMVDPWTMVKRLTPLLRDNGRLIVSVPNIRNWKFIWRLLAKGDFRYRDAGLLDRTHLRFFVRETAAELATCGGLRLLCADPAMQWRFPDFRFLLSRLSGRRLDTLMMKQIIVVAERAP